MTDSPDGGPLSAAPKSPTGASIHRDADDVPRHLSAYGEGQPLLPPMETQADRDAFETEQRRGWQER